MIEERESLDCLEFESRLNELLDGRLPLDDGRLKDHARSCPECNRLLGDYRRILAPHCPLRYLASAESDAFGVSHPRKPTASSLTNARTRVKFLVSLAPSVVALMIVSLSMLIESQTPQVEFAPPSAIWAGVQEVSAGNQATSAARVAVSEAASVPGLTYDLLSATLINQDSLAGGVKKYSTALYQLADDHSPLPTYRLMQQSVVAQVALPHEPLYQPVPYRGEFSSIPQFRFFIGFALRLMQQAFPKSLDSTDSDVGQLLELWGFRDSLA